MSVSIYLRYKLYQLSRLFSSSYDRFRRLRTWWYIYVVFFLYNIYVNSYMVAAGSFAVMLGLSVYIDYVSGRHMYWYRRNVVGMHYNAKKGVVKGGVQG